MKVKDIDSEEIRSYLKTYDFDNYFDVSEAKDGRYVYNLNSGVYFNFDRNNLKFKVVKHDMFWTTISYDIYKTTRLAWFLMKLNRITPKRAFDVVRTGMKVLYVDESVMKKIVDSLL